MNLSELKNKLNTFHFLHEVISLSRNWYWTAPKSLYNEGEKMLIEKAKKLNNIYPSVVNCLILR